MIHPKDTHVGTLLVPPCFQQPRWPNVNTFMKDMALDATPPVDLTMALLGEA